jgi:hypothetical protein
MANFAPNGLTPIFSYSTSALAQAGLAEFPYASQYFHGFAGDVLSPAIFTLAGTITDWVQQTPLGQVVPYPIKLNQGVPGGGQVDAPILGVAVSFRYQPLGLNGQWTYSSNWVLGTAIQPNSTVYVQVQTDIQNIFKVQAGSSASADFSVSVTGDYLFSFWDLNNINQYSPALPVYNDQNFANNLKFGLGNTNLNGTSTNYLDVNQPASTTGQGTVKSQPFTIMGTTNGSQYSNAALQYTETNQWLTVRINWAYQQIYVYAQNP